MSQPVPGPHEHAELNALNLTLVFQAAVNDALGQCAVIQGGNATGFNFDGGRADRLAKITGAYKDFATAEAMRRSSTRTPQPLPAPQIHLPPKVRPAPAEQPPESNTDQPPPFPAVGLPDGP